MEAELDGWRLAPADVVVANLTGAVLRRFADVLRGLVVPGGSMIVSGFSPDECDEVVAALAPGAEQVRVDGEWAAALVRRPPPPPTVASGAAHAAIEGDLDHRGTEGTEICLSHVTLRSEQ